MKWAFTNGEPRPVEPPGPIPPVVGLTSLETGLLIQAVDHLEEFPGDPNRVRFVFRNGAAGQWFSRMWESLTLSRVIPLVLADGAPSINLEDLAKEKS